MVAERRFDPYGVPLAGDGGQPFGYAGESWDADVGLQWLRARWYQPATGRFLSRDPWSGDEMQPLSYNPWAYANANPTVLIDPSGMVPRTPVPPTDRDLTYWLYRELDTHANGPYVRRIRSMLSNLNPIDKVRAVRGWIYLVKDKAKWDFKHEILKEFGGEAVALHDSNRDVKWYEYSVPGNIFYGFVGSAAGFPAAALHAGAGYAEIIDPAHASEAQCLLIPLEWAPKVITPFWRCKSVCGYINLEWVRSGFDEPGDFQNVQFGIDLYRKSRGRLSYHEYLSFFATHGASLTAANEGQIPPWVWRNPAGGWPYAVGHFDGPDTVKNASVVREMLGGSGE